MQSIVSGGMMRSEQSKIKKLQEAIALTIKLNVKSYDVPEVCKRFGIQDYIKNEDADEAHSSKLSYVKKRLIGFSKAELTSIANSVMEEYDNNELSAAVLRVSSHNPGDISDITRRDIVKALNSYNPLFSEVDIYDCLNIIASETLSVPANNSILCSELQKDIYQHYINNDDYTNEELLIRCGVLICSQSKFLRFLEELLHPLLRRGDEQKKLAAELNKFLLNDGYCAIVKEQKSGYPIYSIHNHLGGVKGNIKNLIFASIGAKPEFVIFDAINNDVLITDNADKCLVFDELLPPTGMKWEDMVEWWQRKEHIIDLVEARKALGKRLFESVKMTDSPGEILIFKTYFKRLQKKYGKNLPALIPQVYLHLDPLSHSQRIKLNKPVILQRQRMDFLMLLGGGVRIVIEVDGKQHYSENGIPSPSLYAAMVMEDRKLRLQGYEVFRFGGFEFVPSYHAPSPEDMITDFFEAIFLKNSIIPSS